MILISKYLIPKGYSAITIFPFIVLKYDRLKSDIVLINHEKIHLRQQLELLFIPFYLFYAIEFIFRFLQYKKWTLAYKNISFEREAYQNENNFDYLKSRKFWHFLKYIRINEFQS
jgi:hypothetical protein